MTDTLLPEITVEAARPYYGQQDSGSAAGDFNTMAFVFQRLLSKIRTIDLVQVISCTNSGGVAPVGMVNVQVLTNQMTGNRTPVPHGTIFNLPYLRIQGGASAVILDPVAGDIGMCAFCSRDISAVKVAKGQANPGPYRMFDWADGLYLGSILGVVPTTYVQFTAGGGVNVTSPTEITLTAPNVTIAASTGLTLTTPTAAFSGAITSVSNTTAAGISLDTHVHSNVQSGSSDTGPPV